MSKLDLVHPAVRFFAVLLAVTLPCLATAQAPPESAAHRSAALKKPALQVQTVNPTGAKSARKDSLGIELETASSDRDQSVKDLLESRGLAVDKKTVTAIRALNPAVKADGIVPAGTKITYYSPTFAAGEIASGEKAAFDMALAAKYQLGTERAMAKAIRQTTVMIPSTAYEQEADIATHRRLVSSIDRIAELVQSRAGKMTAKDLALSKYYLAEANAQAEPLSALTEARSVRAASVALLDKSVQPLEGMRLMMLKGGPPFAYRSVNVKVVASAGEPPTEPLRVYTLPGGIIDHPERYTESNIIKDLLIALSFENLTSPSRSNVAQGDMRIWVGPDHAYDEMADLVLKRAPIRFTAVQPSADDAPEQQLEFVSPADVVRP